MELSTEQNEEKKIFIVHIKGVHQRPHDAFDVLQFVINSFDEHGRTRILIDLTEAEIKGGLMDNYKAANPSPELAKDLKKFRFAIVSSEITEHDEFFENLADNRGHRVRFFDNHDVAMEWLGKL
jgi:hypothetical protein